MNTTERLGVSSQEGGRWLIDFLASHRGFSRRQAKSLLDRRLVFVNRRRVWMARHSLQAGDIVELPRICGAGASSPAAPRILYQDADYLIADKPAGLLANGPHSLETRLQAELGMPELAAAHRLDRGTSGCLLFAKNADARQRMRGMFAERKIRKIYHALVNGTIRDRRRTITNPIEGQEAVTEIQVLNANSRFSHLRIGLRTGRTHQIRKHLLAIGHPILGEQYYATRRPLDGLERRFQRPMLHAFQIGFIHPFTGTAVHCTAPLPGDFRQGLAWLHL